MTDWDSCYRDNNLPWNRNQPSPPLVEWVRKNQPTGRALVPGCGLGHDVVMLAESGIDATGLDIAPTAVAKARETYPTHSARFVEGDLFAQPADWLGAFDLVVEHTCLSGLPPEWRERYRQAVTAALKPRGLLVGVWYINPDLDPGESGPPFALPVAELDAMFPPPQWTVVDDYVPATSYADRAGRERVRVLRLNHPNPF